MLTAMVIECDVVCSVEDERWVYNEWNGHVELRGGSESGPKLCLAAQL